MFLLYNKELLTVHLKIQRNLFKKNCSAIFEHSSTTNINFATLIFISEHICVAVKLRCVTTKIFTKKK